MQKNIILAESEQDFATAKNLFLEYAHWLNVDLCFQSFDKELEDIAIQYAAPKGGIFLLNVDNQYIGCVAVRHLKGDETGKIGELKRMYVQDAFRGQGFGKEFLVKALDLAKKLGYEKICLDTLDRLDTAINIYEKNGFYETKPYYHNPLETVRYFEKKL